VGRVIAVANQKGGVGKTTTIINLGACIAQQGKRVLTVDMDPQGNTTSGVGLEKNKLDITLYDLLLGQCLIEDALQETCVPGLRILPSNMELAGAEVELIGRLHREFVLKSILDNTKYLYDFVLIDCPPSLGMLTINALTAADAVMIPIQCEYYALEGLSQLMRTIELVQHRLNPYLVIDGIVFTMFDARTNLSMQVVDEVKRHMGEKVYRTIIPRNVRLSEAPSHGIPITLYDEKSRGAESYMALAGEVIAKSKGEELDLSMFRARLTQS
jgi:chromosome partitioning protein